MITTITKKVFRILISCYNKATMNKKIAMKNTPAGSFDLTAMLYTVYHIL